MNREVDFIQNPTGVYTQKTLSTRLLTRVAINRRRKVAEDELLYHLTAVDPVAGKSDSNFEHATKVILQGSVRIPSSLVDKVANALQQKVKRLGGGSSRGLWES